MSIDAIPSSRLRLASRLARWLGIAVGMALVVTAVIWALWLFWFMPRLELWRPAMQNWATEQLGSPVRIGHVRGSAEGWRAALVFEQVQLLGPKGQAALDLPELTVLVSPASLWRQTIDRLILTAPRLAIWRDANGRLWVGGVAVPDVNPSAGASDNDAVWNALLQARRLRIDNGTLHWRDERIDSEGLTVTGVQLDWRNRNHRHELSVQATPPPEWGAPFHGSADLRTPLLQASSVRALRGTASLHFPDLRVTALRRHVDAGLDLQSGQGTLTVSAQVAEGALRQIAVEGAVSRIQARFAQDLRALDLQDVAGKLVLQPEADGFTLTGEGLRFVTTGGLAWDDAQIRVHSSGLSQPEARTELRAERVNLAALRHVLGTLPIDASVRAAMRRHVVTGWVQSLSASWSRDAQGVLRYRANGQVQDLSVAAAAGIPGMHGLNAAFDFSEQGGEAQLSMRDGRLSFPSVFKEPDIPVAHLSTKAHWMLDGEDWTVRLQQLKLSNDDAQGEFEAEWRTRPVASLPAGGSRFPGLLDLRGGFSRANGARVHRYLPRVVGDDAIRYVREAVQAGQATQVTVRVQGDLAHFPFADARQGTFRIAAPVHGVRLNYVPRYLQPAGQPAWPVLADLKGLLVFEGAGMRVERASGRAQDHPGIRFDQIETHIPDLAHTEVRVKAKGQADVRSGLRFVRASPVAAWLAGALDGMDATGNVGVHLGLTLPVADIGRSQVQGDIVLQGNEVVLLDSVPRLKGAQGRVHFTEQGFSLQDVSAQGVGGPVRLSGGTEGAEADAGRTVIRAEGVASVQGLREEPTLAFLQPLLRQASGSAPYQVAYTVAGGQAQVDVQSGLVGVGLNWPAPLHKAHDAAWPLHVRIDPSASGDDLRVAVGDWLAAHYVREHLPGGALRVREGALALGANAVATLPQPAADIPLWVDLPELDGHAWRKAWADREVDDEVLASSSGQSSEAGQYMPRRFDVKVGVAKDLGRTLAPVHVQGMQRDGQWHAQLTTPLAAGRVVFSPEGAGHVWVRLRHLHVPEPEASNKASALPQGSHGPMSTAATPVRWPSLDVRVDDLRIGTRQLGRLGLEASHRPQDQDDGTWVLKTVSLENPGGHLTASGAWLPANGQGERETRMQFKLVVSDGGQLLGSLNLPGVVQGGAGVLHGVMRWHGAAFSPVMGSLQGEVHAELVKGQFLKADPGLAKLLGVLSLQSLPRRLSLDFRDVFSDGFAFDFIRGDAQITAGVASTNNLQMKGVNAAVLMEGQANLAAQTQDLHALVVPRIDAGSAALVATVINPAVGLGTFVAQLLLSRQINEAATRTLHITGDWANPQVQQLRGRALPEAAEPTPGG